MEDFIKKIFDIDEEAKKYQASLEAKKKDLLKQREIKLKEIDDVYDNILEEEKDSLAKIIKEIEEEELKKLEFFKNKSQEIKKSFTHKKDELVDKFAEVILRSGDFNE